MALATVVLAACGSATAPAQPTPQIIYVTPPPATTPSALRSSTLPPPTSTPIPTTAPTPRPDGYRFAPADDGAGSVLEVTGDAALSYGAFSAIEGQTIRLVVPVANAGPRDLEIHHGATAGEEARPGSHLVITYLDGRPAELVGGGTVRSLIVEDGSDFFTAAWAGTAEDAHQIAAVEVTARGRDPQFDREWWSVDIDEFTSVGATVTVTGRVVNEDAHPRFPPLVIAVFKDRDRRPLTSSVGPETWADREIPVGETASWTVEERLPGMLAERAQFVEVFVSTSLDQWSELGDLTREVRDLIG